MNELFLVETETTNDNYRDRITFLVKSPDTVQAMRNVINNCLPVLEDHYAELVEEGYSPERFGKPGWHASVVSRIGAIDRPGMPQFEGDFAVSGFDACLKISWAIDDQRFWPTVFDDSAARQLYDPLRQDTADLPF